MRTSATEGADVVLACGCCLAIFAAIIIVTAIVGIVLFVTRRGA